MGRRVRGPTKNMPHRKKKMENIIITIIGGIIANAIYDLVKKTFAL